MTYSFCGKGHNAVATYLVMRSSHFVHHCNSTLAKPFRPVTVINSSYLCNNTIKQALQEPRNGSALSHED